VILRPASAADASALAGLETDLFGPDAWSPATVLAELEGPRRTALVAVEGEDVVGYAVALPSADLADLERIAVRADRQRRGTARALLDALLARATEKGADRMLLEVSATNAAALAFYGAAGFAKIDRRRRYYRDGSDAVVMLRRLGRTTGTGGE